jgi:hypothetical protein
MRTRAGSTHDRDVGRIREPQLNQHRKCLILRQREALTKRVQCFEVRYEGVPTGTRMGRQILQQLRLNAFVVGTTITVTTA